MSGRDEVDAGQPYLVEQDGQLTLAFSELAVQSTMDAAAPERLVLEYSRLMMASLLFVPEPGHIGMIGLGGGSLVKACHRHLPRARTLGLTRQCAHRRGSSGRGLPGVRRVAVRACAAQR